jgi:DNA-binding XRE family transcriptional regulator
MIIMKKSVVTKKMVLKDAKNAPALVELQKAVKDNVIEQFIAKRKERGMTQSDVSTVTGIQRPNISRLESGYYNPTLDMLVRLADSIDCNVKITFVDK